MRHQEHLKEGEHIGLMRDYLEDLNKDFEKKSTFFNNFIFITVILNIITLGIIS